MYRTKRAWELCRSNILGIKRIGSINDRSIMTAGGRYCNFCGAEVMLGASFCRECGKPLKSAITTKPGFYKGKHYTEYVNDVQLLIRENRLDDAEKLLLELVNAVESEARKNNEAVAPWYYDRLAVVYRKKKDTESEIRLLERFEHEQGAGGPRKRKLLARLEKLRSR